MIKKLELRQLTDGTFYIDYYSPAHGEEMMYSFPNSCAMIAFLIENFIGADFQDFIIRLKAMKR